MLGKAEPGTVTADDEDAAADFGPLSYDAPTTELPVLGSTEQWNIFNFTADTHPIHLHLVQYQVVEKHEFSSRTRTGTAFRMTRPETG